jgi:hypothetical protein
MRFGHRPDAVPASGRREGHASALRAGVARRPALMMVSARRC